MLSIVVDGFCSLCASSACNLPLPLWNHFCFYYHEILFGSIFLSLGDQKRILHCFLGSLRVATLSIPSKQFTVYKSSMLRHETGFNVAGIDIETER